MYVYSSLNSWWLRIKYCDHQFPLVQQKNLVIYRVGSKCVKVLVCITHIQIGPYMWFLISVLVHCSFSVYFTLSISSFNVTDVNINSFYNVRRVFAINPSVPSPRWDIGPEIFSFSCGQIYQLVATAQKRADTCVQ